jgi:hypothetical protein
MLCINPFFKDGIPFGCGQCIPCRINRRRLWTHRIVLESKLHKVNSFATLTYTDESLFQSPYKNEKPAHKICNDGKIRGNLVPEHMQKFMKRLRRKADPLKLRYVGVGEYGDQTERPHYHLAIFGYPSCAYGRPRITKSSNCKCRPCQELQESWKYGATLNGTLTKDSASYIAGYVTKKMTSKEHDLQVKRSKLTRKLAKTHGKESRENLKKAIHEVEKQEQRLQGRQPEFGRMSNRPGIGADAMDYLVDVLESDYGVEAITDDVPDVLCTDGKKMPLGRYLKEQLRTRMGLSEKGCPEEVLRKMRDESIAQANEIWHKKGCPNETSQKEILLEENRQKVKNLEKRFKIYESKRRI